MGRQTRLRIGISVFWRAQSVLFDGANTLVLAVQLGKIANQHNQATVWGLFTFAGLLAGALIQPVAGDRSGARRQHHLGSIAQKTHG